MAKDDFFVIIYKVLLYLYECLKEGKEAEWERLSSLSLGINEKCWTYVFIYLLKEGYIEGISEVKTLGGEGFADRGIIITPKGIAYLFDNNFLSKAKKTLREIKEVVPFI